MTVMLMQAGFCCLESGMVRAKNSINVAVKNITDFCVSTLTFFVVGFGFMYGDSIGGFVGTSGHFDFAHADGATMAFFLFQSVFCATATTIMSGAAAERMRFHSYILIVLVTAAVIYPVAGHWAWGGLLDGHNEGWLQKLGFLDFAGSTVVHVVGGAVGLGALVHLGPRLGRFGENGRVIGGHDLPMATVGVVLLWFGWLGFNGGSWLEFNDQVPRTLVNTILAGAAGGCTALVISMRTSANVAQAGHVLNGIVAGLVAVTAGCNLTTPGVSVMIGAVGGAIAVLGDRMLIRAGIDDAVGAVSAHGFAGCWGTLAIPLFVAPALYGTGLGRWEQLGVQLLGVVACGTWALVIGWATIRAIECVVPLRVSAQGEEAGLNVVEHGAGNALLDLLTAMDGHRRGGDLSTRVECDGETELGMVAQQYNRVLDDVEREMTGRKRASDLIRKARKRLELRTQELTAVNERLRELDQLKSRFVSTISHELKTPISAILAGAKIIRRYHRERPEVAERFGAVIEAEGERLNTLIHDVLDVTRIEAGELDWQDDDFEMRDVVERAFALISPLADEKDVSLYTEVADDLPTLYGDRGRIIQVAVNVLTNSVKFTPPNGTIHIHAAISTDRRSVVVSISDSGSGIPEDELENIFSGFHQVTSADEPSLKNDGAGLGLLVCRNIIERHGGRIEAQSAPSIGTTISFSMPAGDAASRNLSARPDSEAGETLCAGIPTDAQP